MPLYLPPGTPLHHPDTSRAASRVTSTLFGRTPARWKLERGAGGGLHLHIITPHPPHGVQGAAHVALVDNLRGLLAYHAKPADARLCRPRLTPYTPPPAERRRAALVALEEQAAARRAALAAGGHRLPNVAGWTGRRPAAPPPAPATAAGLLLVALLFLVSEYQRHQRHRHQPGPAPAHRPLPGRAAVPGLSNRRKKTAPPPAAGGGEGRTARGL